ncbi:MAG TPA: gamma carbonic anhydrase family protein [Nitrososphaeraceae archaeon]|jgi:carbonic anhydrase/acetyltransferase-like protein (isoleucine patch superfamily)
MSVLSFNDKRPVVNSECFLAPSCMVIGDVEIGSKSSVWFGCVVRGDVFHIRIGKETNLQDNSVVHVTSNKNPTIIGNRVTVGHSVTLHGCTLKDHVLVGIGAVVMDQSEVGEYSIVAAGSIVKPGTIMPSGTLWGGLPAKEIRDLTLQERTWIEDLASNYVNLSRQYLHQDKMT